MTRRPRILLDVDGPLTLGFFDKACAILRDLGVTHAKTSHVSEWNIARAFGAGVEVEAEMRFRLGAPGIALSFKPRDGAQAFVGGLREWAEVVAVTAPMDGSRTWGYERVEWLVEHFGFRPEEIVLARDKSYVVGDVLVEDRPEYLSAWSLEHRHGLGILWEELHNRTFDWQPRARSYKDIELLLQQIRGDACVGE